MRSITMSCWLPGAPATAWPHLLDLDRLALADPELDLEEIRLDPAGVPGEVEPGTCAIVSRRRGQRVSRIELTIIDVDPPRHLTAALEVAGRSSWWLSIEARAEGPGVSEVTLRARHDEDPGGRRLAPRHSRQDADDVTALVEGLRATLERLPIRV